MPRAARRSFCRSPRAAATPRCGVPQWYRMRGCRLELVKTIADTPHGTAVVDRCVCRGQV